jgi:hypothetical protein
MLLEQWQAVTPLESGQMDRLSLILHSRFAMRQQQLAHFPHIANGKVRPPIWNSPVRQMACKLAAW